MNKCLSFLHLGLLGCLAQPQCDEFVLSYYIVFYQRKENTIKLCLSYFSIALTKYYNQGILFYFLKKKLIRGFLTASKGEPMTIVVGRMAAGIVLEQSLRACISSTDKRERANWK